MNAETRQQDILAQLARRGELTITELSVRFEVSEMTVRRDLNQLAAAGLLVRTHGGAAPAASGSFEPPFSLRTRTNSEAKRKIAALASRQVIDGQTIILDGGSTGVAIAEELVGRNITVCALNLRIAEILSTDQATKVMVPGGIIRTGESSIIGPEVDAALARYRFDVYLMTASAVSTSTGFTEWNVDDAAVKRAALNAARRTLVACDASKFGREAFARICGVDDVDAILTDDALGVDHRRELSLGGLELLIA
ncbi:DeoR/GlpR family DNA-binding transcription regulator [Galbitalea soli]|uniref:Lactose phosphotransferase system repressor n=1 Tax=Galbitalea soli TaxID=1268042 RepID=A0A7C9PMB9_9MICO|nr:DeoR/GlpR family DNA-binding transcription regulator [Galbitalea soli]NEM90874.1 DeoR/GlpR transcriptional regulator [Galbitalea soli]NYJ31594.1 DeoR/GlpR family transcriptional regulator of sugar metabolism [Galbitalea soli]